MSSNIVTVLVVLGERYRGKSSRFAEFLISKFLRNDFSAEQRHIQNPVKHLRWSFLRKFLTAERH